MSEQSRQVQTTKIEPRDAIAPREDDFRQDADTVAEGITLTNAQLRQLAAEFPPPAEWFAGDEGDIF